MSNDKKVLGSSFKWTIERCEANGDHEQVRNSHFCAGRSSR
jgi:hypothetical protein